MSTKANCSPSAAVPIRWATVSLQPMLASNERFVVAIAAVNDRNETRCLRTLDPAGVRLLVPTERKYVSDLIALVTESLDAHLAHTRCLESWTPPVEGVFLDTQQPGRTVNIDEFVKRAASLSTVFYTDPLQRPSAAAAPRRWMDAVAEILAGRDARLCRHLDVRVPLGSHDAPATFSFLDSEFAANLVMFSGSNLKGRVESARAGLWSLNLLADSPYIFRPERKELLAGADAESDSKVKEAIAEITDEAARRDVLVTLVTTPRAVADHIVQYASLQ